MSPIEDHLERDEAIESVRQAVGLLDDTQRLIVRLQYFEAVDEEDIMAMLNLSREVFTRTLGEAHAKLKDELYVIGD